MLFLLFLATACLSGAASANSFAPGGAGSTVRAEAAPRNLAALRDAERRRADAVNTRDVDALRTLIATDYYHVETNGRVRTRADFLQLLTRDEYEFRSYDIANAEIQLLDGGNSAVVRGRFLAQMQPTYRTRDFRGRYVRVWQLGPDGWRNTMMQSTEIRPGR